SLASLAWAESKIALRNFALGRVEAGGSGIAYAVIEHAIAGREIRRRLHILTVGAPGLLCIIGALLSQVLSVGGTGICAGRRRHTRPGVVLMGARIRARRCSERR